MVPEGAPAFAYEFLLAVSPMVNYIGNLGKYYENLLELFEKVQLTCRQARSVWYIDEICIELKEASLTNGSDQ